MPEQPSQPPVTFAHLDGCAPDSGDAPLQVWYREVAFTPIDALSIADLARALRQRIHLAHVVPVALGILSNDPWAGSVFPGELIQSLTNNVNFEAFSDSIRAEAATLLVGLRATQERPAALADDELWRSLLAEIRAVSFALVPAYELRVRAGETSLLGRAFALPGDGVFSVGSAANSDLMVDGLERVAVKIRTADGEVVDVVRVGPWVLLNGRGFSGSSRFVPGDVLTLGRTRQLAIELVRR